MGNRGMGRRGRGRKRIEKSVLRRIGRGGLRMGKGRYWMRVKVKVKDEGEEEEGADGR